MKRRIAAATGWLAIAFCIWALFVWFAAPHIQSLAMLKPFPILLGVLIAIPLSVFSGVYWNRRMFGVTALAFALLVYVGMRLH